MTINEHFTQLATRTESPGPFLTLYLDTKGGDGSQKDRVRILMKQEIARVREALDREAREPENGKEQMIERGIREIESFLNESLSPEAHGVAIFSSPDEEFFLPLELAVPVKPELFIGSRPHLRQLAILRHRHPHMLAALVDAKNGRLCEIRLGKIVDEITVDDPDVPGRTDQGGWSQANIQRHIQDHINHHQKEVSEKLTRLHDQRRPEAIILVGQDRNLANFEQYLPKRVAESIARTIHLDIRAPHEEIVRECESVLLEERYEKTRKLVESLASMAETNGKATLGWSGVAKAVNERKLEHLLIREDLEARGWKCSNCSMIGHNVPLGCPSCGESVLTVDLVEQFISAATSEQARISFAPESSPLDDYDGVGAFLRF
ncbi:MAG: Vms1/Ankzf1 family peptidyl-tRNA hydrolase [Thermoanaerobaculia bacterium]|nr:Vms1/Ankzf1 family peptidyl-tRNA hydrolase [Thermoanaerobaculia bacterium]